MAQHDYNLANGSGAAYRTDSNNVLDAIVSQNSGATAPTTTYSYQWWADTTNSKLKQRNGANNAWIEIGNLDTTNLGLAKLASPSLTGTPSAPTAASGTNTTQIATTAFALSTGFASGVKLVFYQASAPTGWTKITTHNDKARRVVSGTGGGSGGSTAFSSAFTHSHADSFSVSNHSLLLTQIPSHTHTMTTADLGQFRSSGDVYNRPLGVSNKSTGATGGSGGTTLGHNHGLGGAVTSTTIAPHYVDVIICSKD